MISPQNYRTLFLDMNSYFASVEQQVRPLLRGRPIAVTPHTGNTGCVIACSVEAKKYGIKTGFRVGEAKLTYPQIIIVEARPALYMFYHHEIAKVLQSHSPFVCTHSIDEFSILLTGQDSARWASEQMAFSIKQKIVSEVGDYLKCSIGIGPNIFLSKVAAESKKPDGLTLVRLEDLTSFYKKIPLLDLPGINWRLAARFAQYNILTSSQLFNASMTQLIKILGFMGKWWYLRLRGYEVDDFERKKNNIGHSYVLPPQWRNWSDASRVLRKLVEKAGRRLRRDGYLASGVHVGIQFSGGGGWHKSSKTKPYADNLTFWEEVSRLWRGCPKDNPPILLYVCAQNLTRRTFTPLSLFSNERKRLLAASAIDAINDKYGAFTIHSAQIHDLDEAAPDRIPFGQPRYEIEN